MQKEIASLKLKEVSLRKAEPKVDENEFINQAKEELSKVAELQQSFEQIATIFDSLFGSSKARTLLQEHIDKEVSYSGDALEQLLTLSNQLDTVKSSLSRMSNIHSDSYSTIMHYIFPRLGEILRGINPYNLLVVYILYYLIILVLLLYYPLYTALPLTVIIFVTVIVNFKKYDNIIGSFSKAYRVLNIAKNAEQIIANNITKKVLEKKEIIKKDNNAKADELVKEAKELMNKLDKQKLANEKILDDFKKIETKTLNDKLDIINQNELDKEKQVESLREQYANLTDELNITNSNKEELHKQIERLSGISEPLEEKDEILDPNLLLGYDEQTSEPFMLNISDPVYLDIKSATTNEILEIIICQLMNRMNPTKIKIHVYDTQNLGMDFVTYTHAEYREYGLSLITSHKEWEEFMRELEADIRQFRFVLAEFGNIQNFNKYMVENNSATREYHLIILLTPPKTYDFSGYLSNLGIHWISTCIPSKDDEREAFNKIFKNRVEI